MALPFSTEGHEHQVLLTGQQQLLQIIPFCLTGILHLRKVPGGRDGDEEENSEQLLLPVPSSPAAAQPKISVL